MIRVAVNQAAFNAIAAAMSVGNIAYEPPRTEKGEVYIWLVERWIKKLRAMRGPGVSYSAVMLWLAAES